MTATIDVNLLLYASNRRSEHHSRALEVLRGIAGGPSIFYVFWPVIMSYLRMATSPWIFSPPLRPDDARSSVASLIQRAHIRTPGEHDGFWQHFEHVTEGMTIGGNLVPDAHLVALMHQHGVSEIWTHDRDFRRFDGVRVVDPFA